MQRQSRPAVLARLGISIAEALFEQVETVWLYEHYITALYRLAAGFAPLPAAEFMQILLGVPLRERKTYVFAWGKRVAPNFEQFRRIYAEVSGVLSH